jgi:hypothetical protein
MATTITTEAPVVTLINVFTVDPENQQELVRLLDEATETVMRHLPGFVSANIHAGLDGVTVANYAQWRSEEDFEAMLANPVATKHMAEMYSLARVEPRLYSVVSTHER